MESLLLIIILLGALVAFLTGGILLVLYLRSGREEDDPVVFGNLVQCPHCGYMNPLDSAGCLQCRRPLPRPRGHQPAPPPPQAGYGPPSARPTMPPTDYRPSPAAPRPAPAMSRPTPPPQPAPQTTTSQAQQRAPRPQPVPDRPAGMPHAWLEGVSGATAGRNEVLHQVDTLVGRSTACDVQIFDPKVSRRHVRIRYANGAFFLQDQDSSRGTFVNGHRVTAQRLENGDRINLGDTGLVFHVE